jgi:hypothetical protein
VAHACNPIYSKGRDQEEIAGNTLSQVYLTKKKGIKRIQNSNEEMDRASSG